MVFLQLIPMNLMPPDWKGDEKLWKALESVPREAPGSNFAHMVRQKVASSRARVEEPRGSALWGAVKSWIGASDVKISSVGRRSTLRAWAGGVALAAACLTLTLFILQNPRDASSSGDDLSETNPRFELAHVACNYELIQDLDVIEHLDEL